MIRRLTYNCNPESLADVAPEAFVDAFENRIHYFPRFRECDVRVTFNAGFSELVSVAVTDEDSDVADHKQFVADAAERAFDFCCAQKIGS